MATSAFSVSFDYKKASTPTEKAICSNKQLSNLDSVVAKQYKKTFDSHRISDEGTGMCLTELRLVQNQMINTTRMFVWIVDL